MNNENRHFLFSPPSSSPPFATQSSIPSMQQRSTKNFNLLRINIQQPTNPTLLPPQNSPKNSSDRDTHRSELLLLSLNQLLASKNAKNRDLRIPHCRPRDIIIIRHHSFRALRNLWALIYSWDGNLFRLMVKHVHSSQVGRPENCNLLVAHIQYIGPDSMAAKYSYSVSLHPYLGTGSLWCVYVKSFLVCGGRISAWWCGVGR